MSGKTIEQLISLDAKEFQMGSAKVEIAQVNAVGIDEVFERKAEIEEALSRVIAEKELDLFLFVVTDILTNDSTAIAVGEAAKTVEQAFNVTLHNNKATLKGIVSRKKQIVPPLTDALNKVKENRERTAGCCPFLLNQS